jgi:hypothetical protein
MENEKYIPAEDGYLIQVDDLIRSEGAFGTKNRKVTRVTDKFAFYPNNEVSESKFHRIYRTFAWGSLPRPKYPMVHYKVFKKTIEIL